MSVFIRKERLGSGPPPADRFRVPTKMFRGGTPFAQEARNFEAVKQELAEARDDKYEGNAEVQKWRTMTPEERKRDAIERMVPTTKAVTEMRQGREVSYEDARKVAENLAYKSDAMADEGATKNKKADK